MPPVILNKTSQLVNYDVSFWANSFLAIIETLAYHNRLGIFPTTIDLNNISLGYIYSHNNHGFFNLIRNSLQNWALQYLLAHYLKTDAGLEVLNDLFGELSDRHNRYLPPAKADNTFVFVAGSDSIIGNKYLDENYALCSIYGAPMFTLLSNAQKDIAYIDLCIIVNDFPNSYVALLGEVEGLHGKKLQRMSYWKEKSEYCTYGIGVKQLNPYLNQSYEIRTINTNFGLKTLLLLGTKYDVIWGLHQALNCLQHFYYTNTRSLPYPASQPLQFIIDFLDKSWFNPVEVVMSSLKSFSEPVFSSSNLSLEPGRTEPLIITE